ncbi:MAG: mevalonate kinase [Solirubrobacterales bacterium]
MESAAEALGRANARAALVGNPSDGFGGKTISVALAEFAAQATVSRSERLEIVPAAQDRNVYEGVDQLVADVEANGYYGGLRLVKAAIKRFADHCREAGHDFDGRVSVAYATTIPRQVGLGGSSAIVIATMRALAAYLEIELDPARLARLALSAEADELGIPAGLQDRVVQAYGGLVYMDFDPGARQPFEQLDPGLLPPLFVAYRSDASEPSAAVHSDIRARYDRGEPETVAAMDEAASLAERGRACLLAGDHRRLGELMAANVAARARIVELDPRHARMIEVAEALGAPANYAGSGGAVVGIRPEGRRTDELREAFAAEGCDVIEPARRAAGQALSG